MRILSLRRLYVSIVAAFVQVICRFTCCNVPDLFFPFYVGFLSGYLLSICSQQSISSRRAHKVSLRWQPACFELCIQAEDHLNQSSLQQQIVLQKIRRLLTLLHWFAERNWRLIWITVDVIAYVFQVHRTGRESTSLICDRV